jgi:hypothetical protein
VHWRTSKLLHLRAPLCRRLCEHCHCLVHLLLRRRRHRHPRGLAPSTMSSIRTCALHATSCSPSSPGGSSARPGGSCSARPGGSSARHSGHACATLVRPELGRAPAAVRVPARMLHRRRPLARRRSRTSPCRHALPSPCRLAPQCGLPRRHRRRRRAGALVLLTMAQLARSLAVPRAGALSKAGVGLGLVGVLHLLAPFCLVVPGAGSVG